VIERDSGISDLPDRILRLLEVDDGALRPEEIAVISLDWKQMADDFPGLQKRLAAVGIGAARTGSQDMPRGAFSKPEHVTLTSIFPAKGNEAPVIYVMGFEKVGANPRLIVQERNMAFTAMTRTRGWCILTGIGRRAELLFREIENILADPNQITFTVPDPKAIQRNLDNLEYERRRNRIAKAQKLMTQLDRVLEDEDFKALDPALRKRLIDKLSGEE
jgi:superfamily I DNA and RNA helicase